MCCCLRAVTFIAIETAIISLLPKQLLLWKQLLFTLPFAMSHTPNSDMEGRLWHPAMWQWRHADSNNRICSAFIHWQIVPAECTPVFIQCAQQRLPTHSHSDRPHDAIHLSGPVLPLRTCHLCERESCPIWSCLMAALCASCLCWRSSTFPSRQLSLFTTPIGNVGGKGVDSQHWDCPSTHTCTHACTHTHSHIVRLHEVTPWMG